MALQPTTIKLKSCNHDLPIKGECTVRIENQTRKTNANIVVVKGKIDCLPLHGRPSLGELCMLKIDETGGLKEPNKTVNKVRQGNERWSRNSNHLPLKENATPIAQKP